MISRQCGSCQLCCKLVPVASLEKRAGDRCRHQRVGKGCAIYASRPVDCRVWSCAWLTEPAAAALTRPDRSHCVVDPMRDVIRVTPKQGDEPIEFEALQVWCDPAFPDAWRDPQLLGYMEHVARSEAAATLVRYNNISNFVVWMPPFVPDGHCYASPPTAPNPSFGRYSRLPSHERPPL